eukprot:gene38916-37530_t
MVAHGTSFRAPHPTVSFRSQQRNASFRAQGDAGPGVARKSGEAPGAARQGS